MKSILVSIIFLFAVSFAFSQDRPKVKILMINDEATVGFSKDFYLEFPDNGCFTQEFFEYSVTIGEKFNIIRVGDEMNNLRGVMIVDKDGYQIDFSKVQELRRGNYHTYRCCVYVKEFKGKLYFYDIVDYNGADYDCGLDSQTDGSDFKIKRYYIFNPKKNKVEVVMPEYACPELFVDGKLVCE